MSVYDRAAASYERVGPPFFSYFGRRIVDMMGIPDGSRVLDVACGAGAIFLAVVERIGPRGVVVGVDRASAMVDRALGAVKHRGVSNTACWKHREDVCIPFCMAFAHGCIPCGNHGGTYVRKFSREFRTLAFHVRIGVAARGILEAPLWGMIILVGMSKNV
jgi:SAM-dependent methyltransferase